MIIVQVNQFKVRPPDQHEMSNLNKWEKVGSRSQPKVKLLENNNHVKPADAQIEHQNGQIDTNGGDIDHLVHENDRLAGEEALLLDPHRKVEAQDILKV